MHQYKKLTIKELPKNRRNKSLGNTSLFGLWKDRDDIKDATNYVKEIRKPRF
jgi:hypothetical protein